MGKDASGAAGGGLARQGEFRWGDHMALPALGSPHSAATRRPLGYPKDRDATGVGSAPHARSHPIGDTGSDTPLTGHSSPRRWQPNAEKPPLPAQLPRPLAASPTLPGPGDPAPSTREPGPERRALPGAHARSAAARRVHSRRSFQRPRARRRPALLKLASLPPLSPSPPLTLEQEETPL